VEITLEERVAVFPQANEGEAVIAIMLGTGAQHWLDMPHGLQLKATRHSVKMRGGESRVWYGMSELLMFVFCLIDNLNKIHFLIIPSPLIASII
jgi:hypothetical protein